MNETLVFLFRPGPIRWKLWIEDFSSTLILYVPALVVFRSLPAFSTSILKQGPTSPFSGAVLAWADPTSSAAATNARNIVRNIGCPLALCMGGHTEGSADRFPPPERVLAAAR